MQLANRASSAGLACLGSLDDFVGAAKQPNRDANAERLGGLEVDDQFALRGLLDRKVGGILTSEYAAGVDASQPIRLLAQAFGPQRTRIWVP